ncbi:MAG: hypothetical protein AAGC71_11785 [Pseudomonadota bacterium]
MQANWGQPPSEQPLSLLIWTSRIYLQCLVNHRQPPAEQLKCVMARGFVDSAYNVLAEYLDNMLIGSTTTIELHQPQCPCMSPHEQAFVMAVRSAQTGNVIGCKASLQSVLTPCAVQSCVPLLRRISMSVSMAESCCEQDQNALLSIPVIDEQDATERPRLH